MRAIIPVLVLGLLASCVIPGSQVDNIVGNYHFSRGDLQLAMVSYLAVTKDDAANLPYIAFNLANVYYSLGEVEKANEQWSLALSADDPELRYAAHFNQGLARYDLGQYGLALQSFSQALALFPARIEAKRNLELTLARQSALAQQISSRTTVTQSSRGDMGQEYDRLFDYMKRKESRLRLGNQFVDAGEGAFDW